MAEGPLDDYSAAYVSACALLGMQHLHYLDIVYRGLSAQTILVTETGVMQLVDFRFARRNDNARCFTLCGPPQYLAPEMIEGTGHTEAVDWWALGVLVYHLLTGQMPFAGPGDDELRVYKRIVRCAPAYPPLLGPEAKDLIGQLLVRDPDARLGMAPGGVPRLMAHPWFKGIDWGGLREGRTTMPLLLRDRLFTCAGGDLMSWQPPARGPGEPPLWLSEF
ncbi:MAG: kinase-like domain-containing protein [Monoraphidium minutum]|nr:MAG: kinase-like domain-containing protein [Monoraphidium minutum]